MIEVSEDGTSIWFEDAAGDETELCVVKEELGISVLGEINVVLDRDLAAKLAPFIQRFADTGDLVERPKYKILEFDGRFVIKRLEDGKYQSASGWRHRDAQLYTSTVEVLAMIAKLKMDCD